MDHLSGAEAVGLLELRAQVTFRHPLLRSAVLRAASLGERRSVHRALAGATDPLFDPNRRAWHRAHAVAGPDEDVVGELEQSAVRARAGGWPRRRRSWSDRRRLRPTRLGRPMGRCKPPPASISPVSFPTTG
jgi:hypothetical protein